MPYRKGHRMGKKINLEGKQFGRLTVIKDTGKRNHNGSIMWECQCECGNIVCVSGTSLTHEFTKSCGCLQRDTVSMISRNRLQDLSGRRFGRLFVLNIVENIVGEKKKYVCKCDCGNEVVVSAYDLRDGKTKSCGCLRLERVKGQRNPNEYEIIDGYAKVKLNNSDYMICDIEDWENLKRYSWSKGKGGYAVSGTQNGGSVYFHKKVTNTTSEIVDHINRNKLDNRKCNLRITNQRVNGYNAKLSVRNTSGHKGINRSANGEKWIARIYVEGRNMYLGTYETIEEAIKARKKAEEKYYKPLENEAVYLC